MASEISSNVSSMSTMESTSELNTETKRATEDQDNKAWLLLCCILLIILLLLLFLSGFDSLIKSGQQKDPKEEMEEMNYISTKLQNDTISSSEKPPAAEGFINSTTLRKTTKSTSKLTAASTAMKTTAKPTTKATTLAKTTPVTTATTTPAKATATTKTTTTTAKTSITTTAKTTTTTTVKTTTTTTAKPTTTTTKPTTTAKPTTTTTTTTKPTTTAKPTTTTTTTTTTTPWHPEEHLCLYDKTNFEYFSRAYNQDKWPRAVCHTLIFAKTDIYATEEFAKNVKSFETLLTGKNNKGTQFMLAAHVTKDQDPPADLAKKMVELVQKHKFTKGGVMYVYNRTVNKPLTEHYLKFAAHLNKSNVRPLLFVEMYSGWEKDYALEEFAKKFYMALFRSQNIIERLKQTNTKCQGIDNDPSGPSTANEEITRFQGTFHVKFDKHQRRIGYYVLKEGQNNKTIPKSAFNQEIFGVGPLYGSCIYQPLYPTDTDCTALYVFDVSLPKESFVSWVARFILVLHEEQFDNTDKLSCTTDVSIFKCAHSPSAQF